MSQYVATLQDGLQAAYHHAREGLQRAALHQRHDYDGKVQGRETPVHVDAGHGPLWKGSIKPKGPPRRRREDAWKDPTSAQ